MAIDPRKRQKKLERRKAKLKQNKRGQAGESQHDILARIQRAAADAPILHCCTSSELWDQGISAVLVSRQLPNDKVAFTSFLLDMYCLGVKDVFFNVMPEGRYHWDLYDKMRDRCELEDIAPNSARKLIEGAVEYARQCGISPHRDYAKGMLIFGDIDAATATDRFTYGKDGKPFFIAGPNDNPNRCTSILDKLAEHCGPGRFHYLLPVSRPGITPEGSMLSPDELSALEESGEWEIVREGSY